MTWGDVRVLVTLLSISALAIMAAENFRRIDFKRQAIEDGNVCVSYRDSWLGPKIEYAWKPRATLGGAFCPERDRPAGAQGRIGQLAP